MNEELLQMVEGMLANNATQEEVNQAVAEFQSRPEVTTEPESIEQMDPETGSLYTETNNTGEDDRLLSMVQGMLENNATQEEINQEVAAFKNHTSKMEKPEAAVEETAPVVVEAPEDTGSQLEDTSSELWFDVSPEEAEKRLEELYSKTPKSKKNYNGLTGTMSSSPRVLSSEEQVYEHIASGNSAKIKEIEDSVTDEAIFENILEDYKDLDNQTVARGSGMGSSNMVRESDGWDEKTRAKYDAWVANGKNFIGKFGDIVKQSEEFKATKEGMLTNRLTTFSNDLSSEDQDNFKAYQNATEENKNRKKDYYSENLQSTIDDKNAFEQKLEGLNIQELPEYQVKDLKAEYDNLNTRLNNLKENAEYVSDWETQSDYINRSYSKTGKFLNQFAQQGGKFAIGTFTVIEDLINGLSISPGSKNFVSQKNESVLAGGDGLNDLTKERAESLLTEGEGKFEIDTSFLSTPAEELSDADKIASEVKPDDRSGMLKWSTNHLKNLQKDLAENYSKEMNVDQMEWSSMGQVLNLTGDVVASQLTNLLIMAAAPSSKIGAGALFASGFSGRSSEFAIEEDDARKKIEADVEKYNEIKEPKFLEKEKLISDIEASKETVNKSVRLKNAVNGIYGGAEMLDVFSKYAFVSDVKKMFKFIPGDVRPTSGLAKAAFKSYATTQLTDQGVEQSINVIQNFADIYLDDQDKSLTEGWKNVAATSFIMGNGMSGVKGAMTARALVLNSVATQESRAAVMLNFEKQIELEGELKETTDKGTRNIIKRKIKKMQAESALMQDITAADFLNLTKEEQALVFDLDRQARYIKNKYLQSMADPNISETAKDILKEEAIEAYDKKQAEKRLVLDVSGKHVPKSQRPLSGTELSTLGDYKRDYNLVNVSKHQVKAYNERAKAVDIMFGVSGADINSIEQFLADEKAGKTILIDNVELSRSEAQNVIDMQTDQDGAQTTGKFLTTEEGQSQMWVYTDVAAGTGLTNTFVHEYIHAYFQSKGIPKGDFAKIKDNLKNSIKSSSLSEEQKAKALARIEQYEDDTNVTDAQVGEEIFALISDVTANDVLRSEQDRGFWLTLGEQIKDLFNSAPGFENVTEFKTADDVKSFVNDFQKSIIKNKPFKSKLKDSTGPVEDKEISNFSSKSNLQGIFDKSNGKVSEFITNSMNDPKTKEFADNLLDSQFGQEIAPVLETLAKRNFDPIAKDATRVVSENYIEARNIWKNDLLTELISEVSNKYDPNEQDLDKFVTIRAFQRSNRTAKNIGIQSTIEKGGQGIGVDIDKAKGVDSGDLDFSETDNRSTSEKLGFDDTIKNEATSFVKQAVQSTSNKLSGKDLSDKKKANLKKKSFDKFIEDRILPLVKTAIGKNTKTKKDFTDFVSKPANFEALRDLFLDQIDVQKGSGPAALWNIDNPPSLEEFLDYYEGSGTTKSDRRSSLARAVSRSIASEARIEFAKNDPKTAELFKKEHGVSLSNKVPLPNQKRFRTLAGIPGFKDGAYNPAQSYWKAAGFDSEIGYDWGIDGGQNKFIKDFKFAVKKGLPLNAFMTQSKLFNSPRQLKELDSLREKAKRALAKNPTAENKAAYNQADFDRAAMSKTFRGKLDKMLDEIKEEGDYSVLTGDGENWKAKNFITHLGNNPKDIQAKWDDGTIKQFNKSNLSMFEQTMGSLYDLVYQDPSMAQLAFALSPTSYGTSGWFRFGAEVVGYSKDLTSTKDRAIEWEHAMQANNARIFLINSAVNKVAWSTVYPAVKRNYKVIGLDKAYDDVLKAANRGNNMGIGWDVYTGHWTQRYFDPHVVAQGGIDPTTIVDFDGLNFADKYQIDSNGHSTKSMSSKVLDADFNKMLERVKGVKAEAVYSEDRANKIASGKKGLKFFVPYSAEDFVGLIYPTLGKGKEGDRNLQWYKDNLLDPYAIAMSNFEKAKQEAMRDWADLKKKIKSTPAALGKEAVRGFSNEEAVRVYLWNEINAVPDTLAQKDVDALVKHIEGNKALKDFANNVKKILGEQGYPPPTGDWLAGTLTTDLINNVNTVKRAEFLQRWKDNVDVVYSKDNMNKLKAIYGERYTEALENILHRMETGRNRPGGGTRLENQWLDWVNNSVGTVMFFNTRSALLQTISSINFLNWSFNNPLMAAKAFANQPQFWKDFSSLFNSDFLKQRRSGLKNDVNADEIAKAAASSTNKVKAAMAAILKAGFLPTQMADSFAIAIGGASFYRNRVNSLVKEGMTKEQAMEQAMLEFQETAEESQQSSRPDRVSMQQAGGLGRVILAFANTPMQYTRLTKKAALDLVNGRGDWKTNMSKLLYYGAVQNIIFTALQQAMFAMAFDDESDEDEKEAMAKIANGVADTLLRGTGVYGAAATTVKNIVLEAIKQQKSKRTDYTKAALKSLTLSPPIDTKVRKLMSAARAFTYKQSLKDMKTKGASVDNPAALAAGQVISAAANVPIDRFIIKARNIKGALDQQNETWQQIALALGYSEWQLGIEKDKSDEAKPIKYVNPRSKVRKGTITKSRSRVRRPPTKRLDDGVAGVANRDGTIEIDPNLSPVEHEKTKAHEEQHVRDMDSGKLDYDDKYVYWNGAKYARVNGKIKYKGKSYVEGHKSLPWEKVAYAAEPSTSAVKRKLY